MNGYQVAKWTTKTTAVVCPEFGTFATVDEAGEYIVCVLLANPVEFLAGESMYYVTVA